MGCHFLLQEICQPRDSLAVRFFYHWATWEATLVHMSLWPQFFISLAHKILALHKWVSRSGNWYEQRYVQIALEKRSQFSKSGQVTPYMHSAMERAGALQLNSHGFNSPFVQLLAGLPQASVSSKTVGMIIWYMGVVWSYIWNKMKTEAQPEIISAASAIEEDDKACYYGLCARHFIKCFAYNLKSLNNRIYIIYCYSLLLMLFSL